MFNGRQHEILDRLYKEKPKGIVVNKSEVMCLENLFLIGCLNRGFTDKRGTYESTISFTTPGKKMFEHDRVQKSPVKKFYNQLMGFLFY